MDKSIDQLQDTTKADSGYELYGQKRQKQSKGAKAVMEQLVKRKKDDKSINMMEQPLWGTVKNHLQASRPESREKTISTPTGIENPELIQNIAARVKTRPLR